MVGGTVKGKAFPSKSKCEALTLMSAESEPSKSSMKEFAGSSLDGEGEINKIQNKQEKCMDGSKTDVRFCGPVVGKLIKVKGHFVCEGNDEKRDIVDEIKLNTSDHALITGKTRGYLEVVNDGGAIANNKEEINIEEVTVKENAPVPFGLDIKYPNIGEERKSLEVATNNIVDGGSTSEFQIAGKALTDNPQTEKEDNELHPEVPIFANIGIESVIYGLDIIDPHIREERKNLDVATSNLVDGRLAACDLQVTGNHLTDNSQNEKEANKLNTELRLGTNLDNEIGVCGVDIKDAVVRGGRMSLEMGTDNMVDCTLPTPELQIAGRNLRDSLQNEKEVNRLKPELGMGNRLDNETVVYEIDIKDAVVKEEIKSLDMATDKIVDQTLSVPELRLTSPPPELQIKGKNLMDSLQNEKEANSLKSEVAMGTNLRNMTMIFGVDISDANTRGGKSLNLTTDNIVYGGFSASELQREGKNLTYSPHDEKEVKMLNTEVPMGTNLDNKTVIYGVDIKNAVVRQERKSLEMATDDMIDRALPAPELKIAGKNQTGSLKIGGKANWLKPEEAMGTNLDSETVVYRVDINDAAVREERKCLKMPNDNMVDRALPAPKLQITGKKRMLTLLNEKKASRVKTEVPMGISLHPGTVIYGGDFSDATSEDGKSLNLTTENVYNPHNEKKTDKLDIEVPMGTNLNNETVVCGVDIKDVVSEERSGLDMATANVVDRALPAPELQITGKNLNSVQNEKEHNFLKLEVAMGANLDIKDAVVRVEKKSLGMATDNMVDRALPTPELQITGADLMVSLQNEKEANRLKTEVAVGTNLHNETVIYGDVSDLNTREGGKSLNMTTENIVGGGFTASEFQIEGKIVTYNLPDNKEANELNTEVPICTNIDNGKMECGSVDASVANNAKESANNVGIPKRRRLNRKMFEKTIFGNNEASMNNAKPQSSIGNDPCIEINDADMNKHVRIDGKAETKPLVIIGRKMNRLRRKRVPQGHAGTATSNDEQKSQCTNDEPENKVNREIDELDLKGKAENSQRNKEEKVEPERNKKVAVERSKSSKRVDFAGMIFICSSETKNKCFNYRVLGLPASKRDIVSKIYTGMRLFLFDCDLKMMYGIFKAVGPGGFNIEPMAFGSQYPSQVRFTVVEDCNPLVEEKFRNVIKDNYYTKHKFNFQLTSEQTRNLCQLFHYNSKTAESKLGITIGNTATSSPVQHDRKRRRVEDSKIPSQRYRRHPTSYEHDTLYETEAYVGPSEPPTLYDSLPPQDTLHIPSCSYDEPMIMDMHRRDLALNHHSYIGTDAYNERVYATGAFHAYEQPTHDCLDLECETQEQGYENGVNRAYTEPDYRAGLRHEYETGVIYGYRVPTHETVVSHVLQEPTRVDAYRRAIHETSVIHASREPRYQETRYDANQEPYGYSSGQPQAMYYEHDGQYYRY